MDTGSRLSDKGLQSTDTGLRLPDMKPHVGAARYYLYDGGLYEGMRTSNSYALHLFTGGDGMMTVEGKEYKVGKGILIFLRPGQLHSFHIRSEPLPSHNLYFDLWEETANLKSPQLKFALYPQIVAKESRSADPPLAELEQLPTRFSLHAYPQLLDGLMQIQQIYDNTLHYRTETVNSAFYTWLLQWYNILCAPRPTDKRIIQMLEQLEREPERYTSYEAWCRQFGLQKSHFFKLFKKETGLSPKACILKIKMKKAAALLIESHGSITAIAEELGYASIHYFSRQFRAVYGVSPSEFRGRTMIVEDRHQEI
ncbi:AraC family transcriptional regulator [Paenibacillaceae bacterium]|nr:AraC family transcriptional regulator [Paenibacillaceae bacterium]